MEDNSTMVIFFGMGGSGYFGPGVIVPEVTSPSAELRSSYAPTIKDLDNERIGVSGAQSATKAGTYQLIFSLKDPNDTWVDGTKDPITVSWTVPALYHHHSLTTDASYSASNVAGSYGDGYVASSSGGCFTRIKYHQHTGSMYQGTGCYAGGTRHTGTNSPSYGSHSWAKRTDHGNLQIYVTKGSHDWHKVDGGGGRTVNYGKHSWVQQGVVTGDDNQTITGYTYFCVNCSKTVTMSTHTPPDDYYDGGCTSKDSEGYSITYYTTWKCSYCENTTKSTATGTKANNFAAFSVAPSSDYDGGCNATNSPGFSRTLTQKWACQYCGNTTTTSVTEKSGSSFEKEPPTPSGGTCYSTSNPGYRAGSSYTYYDLNCGKTTSTVEGYSCSCGKTEGQQIN